MVFKKMMIPWLALTMAGGICVSAAVAVDPTAASAGDAAVTGAPAAVTEQAAAPAEEVPEEYWWEGEWEIFGEWKENEYDIVPATGKIVFGDYDAAVMGGKVEITDPSGETKEYPFMFDSDYIFVRYEKDDERVWDMDDGTFCIINEAADADYYFRRPKENP